MTESTFQREGLVTRLQIFALLVARLGVMGMAISMPISRAMFNMCAAIMILGWLLSGNWRHKLQTLSTCAISIASIALFTVCALSLFWGPEVGSDQWDALRGYSRLLYIPIIITSITTQTWTNRTWSALISGMIFTLTVYLLDIWFEIPGTGTFGTNSAGQGVFYHHIAQGMVLSFIGAYALHTGLQITTRNLMRSIWLTISAAALIGALTVGISRTGQITTIVAYFIVINAHLSFKSRAIFAAAILIASTILIGTSPRSYNRLVQGVQEASTYKMDGESTSIGARLKAWEFSLELIDQAPWLGHGIGTYKEKAHSHFKASSICTLGVCEQPHNQFIATTVETGLIGLFAMLAWIAVCITGGRQLPKTKNTALVTVLISIFCITALLDSSLKIQAQAFFTITTLALLVSRNKINH